MCGIFGAALASQQAAPVVVEGLGRLEYRGYDSVGVATVQGEKLYIRKARGSLAEVEARLGLSRLPGRVAIGHTRWATHGEPSDANAHPLTDCRGRVALVANGIVENYAELRGQLLDRGHVYRSETDVEAIAHLVEEGLGRGLGPLEALREAAGQARGRIAVAMLVAGREEIYFYRRGSPLVVGLAGQASYLASDIPALLGVAERILVLEDGDSGVLRPGSAEIYDARGVRVEPSAREVRVEWGPGSASKMGYRHYMLKEIYEQPSALQETLSHLEGVEAAAHLVAGARRVYAAAAGTSLHAALLFSRLASLYAGVPVYTFTASEYRWLLPSVSEGDVLVAVTQSGETADTLEAMRGFAEKGARVVAVVNVPSSAATRLADITLYTRAGPEVAVAATKTFTAQTAVLAALALRVAAETGGLGDGEAASMLRELRGAPRLMARVLEAGGEWGRRLGWRLAAAGSAYYLGRGLSVPLAMEGALKLKEIAYVHAEAYPAGESKHGPIALVEPGFPVVFVDLGDESEKLLGNVEEMRARGAYTALVGPKGSQGCGAADYCLQLPPAPLHVAAVTYIAPLQLAAYHASVTRGVNPDRPRNLAKSVTVE